MDCIGCEAHTDWVDASVSNDRLAVLIDMEPCPAERRALVRIGMSRTLSNRR